MSSSWKDLWEKDRITILCLLVVAALLILIVLIYPETEHYIEVAAALLAVITLIFAIRQYLDARRQTDHLGKISDSLSTRYLGKFPSFFPDIIQLVERAEKKLTIFCSHPVLGHFSAPGYFLDYEKAIKSKLLQQTFDIQFTHLDQKEVDTLFDEQFPSASWEEWKNEHTQLLDDFLAKQPKAEVRTVDNLQHEDFKNLCMERVKIALNDGSYMGHKKKVALVESHIPMSIYFWIRDEDQEAVFMFPHFDAGDTPHFGFYTVDPRLITALKSIAQRYRDAQKSPEV